MRVEGLKFGAHLKHPSSAWTAPLQPPVVLLALLLAFWDAWRWYFERVAPTPEVALALVGVAALVIAVALGGRRWNGAIRLHPLPHLPLTALLLLYAVAHLGAPPILRAAIAALTILFAVHRTLAGSRLPAAFCGLVLLALPVVPTLQFYLGYPMRLVSAAATVALLEANGLNVSRQGTMLVWHGELVQFDAPCSGVTMLWASLLLASIVAFLYRFGPAKCLAVALAAVVLALGSNILRAASLFYIEAGLLRAPADWWHEGVGVAAFALSAAALVAVCAKLRTEER